jgi:hypothetical protein
MSKLKFYFWQITLFIMLFAPNCILAEFFPFISALLRPKGSGSRRPLNADPMRIRTGYGSETLCLTVSDTGTGTALTVIGTGISSVLKALSNM